MDFIATGFHVLLRTGHMTAGSSALALTIRFLSRFYRVFFSLINKWTHFTLPCLLKSDHSGEGAPDAEWCTVRKAHVPEIGSVKSG